MLLLQVKVHIEGNLPEYIRSQSLGNSTIILVNREQNMNLSVAGDKRENFPIAATSKYYTKMVQKLLGKVLGGTINAN